MSYFEERIKNRREKIKKIDKDIDMFEFILRLGINFSIFASAVILIALLKTNFFATISALIFMTILVLITRYQIKRSK